MSTTFSSTTSTDMTIAWSFSDTSITFNGNDGLLKAKNNDNVNVFAKANDGSDIQGKLLISISNQVDAIQGIKNENNVFIFPNSIDYGILNIKQSINSKVDIAIYNINGHIVLNKK